MAEVLLAFDYGSQRIGVAISNRARPIALKTIKNSDSLEHDIQALVDEYKPSKFVVGLPRNLDGEETKQTQLCREFAKYLEKYKLPVALYDETLSSERAASRLGPLTIHARRKKIDAMAAQIILEDYIRHATK